MLVVSAGKLGNEDKSLVGLDITVCGIQVRISCEKSILTEVESLLEPYKNQGKPLYNITLGSEDGGSTVGLSGLAFHLLQQTIRVDGWSGRDFSVRITYNDIEGVSAAAGCMLVKLLSENKGVLLHCACLVRDGEAHLFLGRSGAGKSTVARTATGMGCIHEDKASVRLTGTGWNAYSVPMLENGRLIGKVFSGPIGGLYLLRKDVQPGMRLLGAKESLFLMPEHVIVPTADSMIRRLTYLTLFDMVNSLRVYELRFSRNTDVGKIIE